MAKLRFQTISFDDSPLHPVYKVIKGIIDCSKERVKIKYPPGITTTDDTEWSTNYRGKIVSNKHNAHIFESCKNRAGVYGIYTTVKGEKAKLKYIGQTTDETSLMRIVSHLIYKSKGSGSKLKEMREAVMNKEKIELVFVEITPKVLREYVEHKLILDLKPHWNKKH